ncbi:MAG TPA: hypothetical protein VGR34_06885 [Candidatus Dormibacteraeota bacterium]|nr:hypothetical protein [Candidatus Dormibacteraeota bacterium]
MSANLPRVAVLALLAWAPLPVRAGEIDTEHLFGFTIGTDIGEVGEKEIEGQTTGRFGKRDGSYIALSQMLSAAATDKKLPLETRQYRHRIGVGIAKRYSSRSSERRRGRRICKISTGRRVGETAA